MDTKTRLKAPAKTYRGGQFAVQKISISRACETKLGCVLSFLENAINGTSINLLVVYLIGYITVDYQLIVYSKIVARVIVT